MGVNIRFGEIPAKIIDWKRAEQWMGSIGASKKQCDKTSNRE
jgi:hypothetical protein